MIFLADNYKTDIVTLPLHSRESLNETSIILARLQMTHGKDKLHATERSDCLPVGIREREPGEMIAINCLVDYSDFRARHTVTIHNLIGSEIGDGDNPVGREYRAAHSRAEKKIAWERVCTWIAAETKVMDSHNHLGAAQLRGVEKRRMKDIPLLQSLLTTPKRILGEATAHLVEKAVAMERYSLDPEVGLKMLTGIIKMLLQDIQHIFILLIEQREIVHKIVDVLLYPTAVWEEKRTVNSYLHLGKLCLRQVLYIERCMINF